MIKKSDTIPIIYGVGEYGNYLYWVLNNFTSIGLHDSPELPWGRCGNSHNQTNINNGYRNTFNDWVAFVNDDDSLPFFLTHYFYEDERDYDSDSFDNCTNDIVSLSKNAIALMYTEDITLLVLNNSLTKMNPRITFLKNAFEIDKDSNLNVREQVSYKPIKFRKKLNISNNRCLNIYIKDLLFDFENTITKIINRFGWQLTEDISILKSNHNKMLSLQTHITKDKDIKLFLENFIERLDCKLPANCSIIDEAYVQKYLRDELQLELRCDDIGDNFPQTTEELWKYTYPAKELHEQTTI